MTESKEAQNAMADGARALAGCPPNLRIKFYEGVYQTNMLSQKILEAREQLDRLHARWQETTGAPYEPESKPEKKGTLMGTMAITCKVVGLPERTTEHDIDVIRRAYHILGAQGHEWRGRNHATGQELLNDLRDLLARATGKTSQEVQDKLPVWPVKPEPDEPAGPQAKDVVIPGWEEPKMWHANGGSKSVFVDPRAGINCSLFATTATTESEDAIQAYNWAVGKYRSRIARLENMLISLGAKYAEP